MNMNTINDLELSVQAGIEALRDIELNLSAASAREVLLPEGLTPVVELVSDSLRRKRSSAAAWNWNPQTDRIIISFRPISSSQSEPETKPAAPPEERKGPGSLSNDFPSTVNQSPASPDCVTSQEIVECCQALATAERSNRQFIALKWFRDDFLMTVDYAWAQNPQRRQRVLSHAIDIGRIETKKLHNPKAPQFPTTTISLNRSVPTPGVPPRFHPVSIRGESASATLLRDRGAI
jgi:hypothetical protein